MHYIRITFFLITFKYNLISKVYCEMNSTVTGTEPNGSEKSKSGLSPLMILLLSFATGLIVFGVLGFLMMKVFHKRDDSVINSGNYIINLSFKLTLVPNN